MKFGKIFIMAALFSTLLFAISRSQIEPTMASKVEQAVEILKNQSIAKDSKPKMLFGLFDEYFDYKFMSKLSLSKYYKTLSSDQADKFNTAFEDRLKQSFIDKLALYSDQDMKVVGSEVPNDKRFYLKTEIIGKEKNYPIVFKFYPAKPDVWKIYDVDILGVSIVQSYRSQFGELVDNVSFDEILRRLNEANLPDDKVK